MSRDSDPQLPFQIEDRLRPKLQLLLNSVSAENGSNTPDFILARYMQACLEAFDVAVNDRERWYGRGK